MDELDNIINPNEAILVIDGTIGQQAGEQAKAFSQATDIGSIIITKLDGSAKGGGAMSAVAETGAPIKFIGTGERIDDFELFDPERFISRLLGMGDIKSLIEKAEENIDEDIAEKTMNNMLTGKFTLEDMKNQFEMMNKMGPMQQVLNMIPGMGNKITKEASKMTEEKIESYKVIMSSMTEEEMKNPKIIKQSRVRRIARGAGVEESDVKELLKYYNNTKKTMKGLGKRGGRLGGGGVGFRGVLAPCGGASGKDHQEREQQSEKTAVLFHFFISLLFINVIDDYSRHSSGNEAEAFVDDGIAMKSKIEAADAIVTVKYDGIALCGIGRAEIEHTHIHTNSADYLAHSAKFAVWRVDRDLASRRVAENAVGVADSDSRGVDLLFNAVGAAVAELLALGETVNSRDLGAELEGGLETEINSRRGTEAEKRNAYASRVCKIL